MMRDERSTLDCVIQAHRRLHLRIVVTVVAVAGTGALLYVARNMLVPLIIGAIIAVILFPWARRLRRLLQISHQLATAII